MLSLVFGSAANAADQAETQIWDDAISANTPDGYFNYLSRYPAGEFVEQAVQKLVELGAVSTRGIEVERPKRTPAPNNQRVYP